MCGPKVVASTSVQSQSTDGGVGAGVCGGRRPAAGGGPPLVPVVRIHTHPVLRSSMRTTVSGINFAYSQEDKQQFVHQNTPNQSARIRMRRIWHHTLTVFQQAEVDCPVLCAIGCGAFTGNVDNVPSTFPCAMGCTGT